MMGTPHGGQPVTQTGELIGREHTPLCGAERIANEFGLGRAGKPSEA